MLKEAREVKLFSYDDILNFSINDVCDLYKKYVNPGQVEFISSFGPERNLVEKAEGSRIYCQDGRMIRDFTGGIGVLNHGHNHPEILEVRKRFQNEKRMEVHKNYLSPYLAALSANIAALMPGDLKISYFCNSGAESVEGAVKLAYKAHEGYRSRIMASDISFHGKLLGSAGLTGSPEVHFKWPTIPNIDKFKYNDIQSIKDLITKNRKSNGESDYYAVIIEPFNASSLLECSTMFLQELRNVCDKENIILIFDEVYTGWSKTGALFNFFYHDVIPDIVTMSKSFGAGKSSIAGYVTREKIFLRAYGKLNDSIIHSTTYNGFGEECVTALEGIRILVRDNYSEKAKKIETIIRQGLTKITEVNKEFIVDIRGRGGLMGCLLIITKKCYIESRVNMELIGLKYLVVGAGFYGATIADQIANILDSRVLVIDVRKHIGGNSYSYPDSQTNIEVHQYGSHIFHTSNKNVWKYINQFGAFNSYRHRVFVNFRNEIYTMPINLMTINQFYKKNLSPEEAQMLIKEEISKDKFDDPKNLEEKAISLVGRSLYDAFIKGYTQKQWNTSLTELPPNIITRLPVRYNFNDRYFNDIYEGIPVDGYGKIFEKMLAHPNITLKLGVDFFDLKSRVPTDCLVIYTGPIDRFFEYKYGMLGWRTTYFEEKRIPKNDFQGTAVMNYADLDIPYTRIHEFKHYHPEREQSKDMTILFKEYSKFAEKNDIPYYPINTERDRALLKLYQEDTKKEKNVIFGGRLGNYVYVDMHQVISMALNTFQTKIRGYTKFS